MAIASKLAGSAGKHEPIDVTVPSSYEPAIGPNKWLTQAAELPQTQLGLQLAPALPPAQQVDVAHGGIKAWLSPSSSSAPAAEPPNLNA